jgi:hypothetical protein
VKNIVQNDVFKFVTLTVEKVAKNVGYLLLQFFLKTTQSLQMPNKRKFALSEASFLKLG